MNDETAKLYPVPAPLLGAAKDFPMRHLIFDCEHKHDLTFLHLLQLRHAFDSAPDDIKQQFIDYVLAYHATQTASGHTAAIANDQ